jgi:hypothetical protein
VVRLVHTVCSEGNMTGSALRGFWSKTPSYLQPAEHVLFMSFSPKNEKSSQWVYMMNAPQQEQCLLFMNRRAFMAWTGLNGRLSPLCPAVLFVS